MNQDDFQNAEKFTKAHKKRKRWYKMVTCLACMVVFCTVYALIMPAVTLEKKTCDIPEHTHTAECYAPAETVQKTVPVCDAKTLDIHEHTAGCYDADGNLTCGYADFVVHHHDASCYDEDGKLWCPLPEIEVHQHKGSCYIVPEAAAKEVHTHTEDCYTLERGELICTESTEAHQHTDDCYTETSTLICEEDHEHEENCYEVSRELTCGLTEEPAHRHTDDCYAWNKVLTCDLPTEPEEDITEQAEPVLICDQTEVILHEHSAGCYDAGGKLTCGRLEILEHQHTEECFETVEEPSDTETLICGLEEHTHTEECNVTQETVDDQNAENEESVEQTVADGLSVMGTAYGEGGTEVSYAVMALDADTEGETGEETDTLETTGPLNVEDYVDDAKLYYRTGDNAEWINVSGATDIPGDADFRLEIDYKIVPIDILLAAGGKMTFTLPDLFRNATTKGSITSGTTTVGSITVEGKVVTLAFDTTWLEEQRTETNTVIKGDFYVEAEADLSQIGGEQPSEIVIGDVKITIDFDEDVVAKYGNVNIAKTVSSISEETDGDYLTYTLTVTAGPDGCPDVKVVDQFTNTQYIERYMGVTGISSSTNDGDGPQETGGTGSVYIGASPTEENPIPDPAGENVSEPGTLVWVVGDMAANETRTLTYRVKLKDEYTGATTKGNLQNTANVYSKSYQRDSDTVTFTPKAAATLSKVGSSFSANENGGGTITYTIWVNALADNSYTLDNVKIVDALDGSIQNMNSTLASIRQYLSYDENSFHLYQGGVKDQNGSDGLTEILVGTGPAFVDTDSDGKYNDSFTYYVGSLAPGESKTLIYTVNVEPGVFVASGNEDMVINNRARIFTDDNRNDGNSPLNAYNTNKTISRKAWSRKLVGAQQETEKTVSMSGSVYDATGSEITPITSPDSSFTVPAGSYQYQVVANEAGDWDLSSASMADTLGNQYMQFVGYVRVDAYTISGNAPSSDLTDEAAIANLSARTPDQTVWVKVDGQQSFEFTPGAIGLGETCAYLLTYYAQPVGTDSISQVVVSNNFLLSGSVGIGDLKYVLTGIGVSASVTVEGDNSFNAEKLSWYYEEPKVTTGDFKNGALYWVIRVDGKLLPSGTVIKDITNQAGGSAHYIRGNSFVGAYTGDFGTDSPTDYENLEVLLASSRLTELNDSNYTVTKDNNSLTVTLNTDVTLENGSSLYIILKTEPNVLPSAKRDAYTFNNKLQSSSDGTSWLDHNVVGKTLYGSENIFKELGRVFTYSGSGSDITVIQEGTQQGIATDYLDGAGTYVAWQIHVNYEGNLSGRYRVVEQIPEGMEVTYARIWWLGPKAVIQSPMPAVVQLSQDEFAALGSGWTENTKQMGSNNAGSQSNYYYTNGRRVIWDIDNLYAGGGTRDDYAVEFQIVCRVTDPEVLLGGVSKDFNNVVILQNPEGTTIGNDSNGVTIQKQTLAKTGTYNAETNGGRYPFRITLNELGEDLVAGADTITLVDELSSTLILDTSSIQVVNTKTGEAVTGWTSSVEGQTLKIVLPDNLPLTITYEATVNAAPGQTISISNNAHWEGYTTPSGGSVEDNDFSYSAGGTVGVDTSPSLTVKKLDQYNTSLMLAGAEFTLREETYENGTFTETTDGLSLTGATAEDGTLTFGKESGQMMKYNTVYCLTETKAPEGYVLDAAPHYFAVAKPNEDGTYLDFPEGVTVWYQSANYTYQAYNHKGEATVKKAFQDGDGQSLDKIDGTYRFGIYAEKNPTGAPLQTVTITYANGAVMPENGVARFTNLTLGGIYYIYELDDSGNPVQGNDTLAAVDGSVFSVTYSSGPAVTIPADGSAAVTVTVTNKVRYFELPGTGGTGTGLFYILGCILAVSAFVLLISRKRGNIKNGC